MYCSKCGNSIPDNITICPVCGNRIINQIKSDQNWNEMPANVYSQNQNQMSQNSLGHTSGSSLPKPVQTGNLWMVISILAILVIFLSGVVILFILRSYRGEKSQNASSRVEETNIENDKSNTSEVRGSNKDNSSINEKYDKQIKENVEEKKEYGDETKEDSPEITNEEPTEEEIITEATTEVAASDENMLASGNVSANESFYGIWCYGSKVEADAIGFVDTMKANGFDAEYLLTTDWANLNSEPYYVVTVGRYATEEEAKNKLPDVTACPVSSDAYVKYSGDYIGN